MPNEAKGAIIFVLGVLSGLAFVFALVMWGINKFGDQQGGLAEKSMMGGISAGVAFAAAAVMVQGIDMNYHAG